MRRLARGAALGMPTSADSHQDPDYTVTGTPDGGGQVLTNVEVAVIFWGSYWNGSPAVSPATYYNCMSGIVTGPYMTGLRQYRGVGPGTVLGMFINATPPDPVNGYMDSDVVTMLTAFLQNNSSVPAPIAGHTRFYAVVTPPGVDNGLPGAVAQHQPFTYNGVPAWYAWINSDDGLDETNQSYGVINSFSHELSEACTDPNGDAFHVNGTTSTGTAVTGDEIGDTCGNEFANVMINGVECNVQCIWSAADNACIIVLGSLSFIVNKSTFGLDEVKEAIKNNNGVFSSAFWLALDDFSIDTFNSFQVAIPTPTGPFFGQPGSPAGITISATPATPSGNTPAQPIPIYEDQTNTSKIQRIRFSFDVTFANPLTTPFPSSGTMDYPLTATFTTAGQTVPGVNSSDTINFELASGEDPYFSNMDPTNNNALAWLSQDLRVFPLIQSASALPGDPMAPVFSSGQKPYDYIQSLISYLNGSATYTVPVPPSSPDPLNGLPNQQGYETGDTSVMPQDSTGAQNYNFAIARVRLTSNLQGSASEATDVRVFFRLWIAPSCDTDFNPNTTYLSSPAYPGKPTKPLASSANLPPDPTGQNIRTTPFFCTDNVGTNDYTASYPHNSTQNNNIQSIEIPAVPGQDGVWTYYGCFLDVYDQHNNSLYPGTHHCLVAQIAYDDAPVDYSSGVDTSPFNSDKLAQRNLQISSSGNPGPISTHRVPQAFDTRPSPQIFNSAGALVSAPDELMIDWGDTPTGSTAHVYWPQVEAADVVSLATRVYGPNSFVASDNHTISFPVASKGVTYLPIPYADGKNFAGLLTVDLPLGVKKGQEFNIVVRRVATAKIDPVVIQARSQGAAPARRPAPNWRYVTGAFQVRIPVMTEEAMLWTEENTLAIFKARLAGMSRVYRWYPVLQRYIEIIAGRVNGSGGHSSTIPPSFQGFPPQATGQGGTGPGHPHEQGTAHTGKIVGLLFDKFGDFEGFLLEGEHDEQRYESRQRDMKDLIERAWREGLRVTVVSEKIRPHIPKTVILHSPPARFGV